MNANKIKSGFKIVKARDFSNVDFNDVKINNVETLNIDKLENDFIDLGLSVKWAKCNIGATCSYDIDSWYGDYYSWGEIHPKYDVGYKRDNAIPNSKYDENNVSLHLEDDVVTQTYLKIEKFRMPTFDECRELIDNTTHKWETNYNGIDGLNGVSFIGKTQNSIFIPAAGYYSQMKHVGINNICDLWTNEINPSYSQLKMACHIDIDIMNKDIHMAVSLHYYGFNVRGVCLKNKG